MAASSDEKERAALAQFRNMILDLTLKKSQMSDHFLLRWLRARDHDLDKAEAMLSKYLDYRENMDVDNLLLWEPSKEWKNWAPFKLIGYDQENSPVLLVPFGKWNIRKISETGLINEYLKYVERVYEEIEVIMAGMKTPDGFPVSQFVYIFDMDKLSMMAFSNMQVIDTFMQGSKNFEAYHPETVKRFYILNAGRVFSAVYALVKPILAQKTVEKLRIFGNNREKYKGELLKNLPAEILPPQYGGMNMDAEDLAKIDVEDENEEEQLFMSVSVPAGEKLVLNFGVDEGNSTISWAFKTDKYDISFGVTRDGKAYIEKSKVDSHLDLQEGTIKCDQPGDYIFTFDNSYSRLRGKILNYCVNIKSPSGLKQISID